MASWEQVCQSKQGDLGVHDLKGMNKTLYKYWWRIMKFPNRLIYRVLKDKYGPRQGLWLGQHKN